MAVLSKVKFNQHARYMAVTPFHPLHAWKPKSVLQLRCTVFVLLQDSWQRQCKSAKVGRNTNQDSGKGHGVGRAAGACKGYCAVAADAKHPPTRGEGPLIAQGCLTLQRSVFAGNAALGSF